MTARAMAIVPALLVTAAVAGANRPGPQAAHSREAFVMGTRVVLTTYAGTRAHGLAQLERMLAVIERTEGELSTWRAESEVSRLNAAAGGAPQPLAPATCRLLSDVSGLVADTRGVFDPAIGALTAAWDLHGRGRVPSAGDLAAARARSGWRHVTLDGDRCTLRLSAGASIDVGGFGKGEALDRVRREMGAAGPWLVDLGGQVAVAGAPPGETAWSVTLAHPRVRTRPVVSLAMTGGSLSTSAGSERDLLVRGTRVGHVLDPRTGEPSPFDGSVSVWSERALTADVLSTALYVMGPGEGLRWADAHDVAVLFLQVDRGGHLDQRPSREFSRRFGLRSAAAPPDLSSLDRARQPAGPGVRGR